MKYALGSLLRVLEHLPRVPEYLLRTAPSVCSGPPSLTLTPNS